ncbi:stretch-activated cation channel Mid1p [[Candida] railenensis]|uniref:Stretch-activated cation channel Mid1p n=1 Tax=[Candida] railenensis TaxID=45579 RepID=A0A9P0QSS8_9ASCO|nr:stretch-activated cation channel Mid1p [[Candida] railenensis]
MRLFLVFIIGILTLEVRAAFDLGFLSDELEKDETFFHDFVNQFLPSDKENPVIEERAAALTNYLPEDSTTAIPESAIGGKSKSHATSSKAATTSAASSSSSKSDGDVLTYSADYMSEYIPYFGSITQSSTQYFQFLVNTSSGVGSNYEFLIFLSGNIGQQPNNTEDSLTFYHTFNASMLNSTFDDNFATLNSFQDGYFEAIDVFTPPAYGGSTPGSGDKETVYMKVVAPENTDKDATWEYAIGISQQNLVFQWDNRTWASVVDADDNSALIVTGNLTTTETITYGTDIAYNDSYYYLQIYPSSYNSSFEGLSKSWYAISKGPSLTTSSDSNINYTTTYIQRNGELQQQFYVVGLNESTEYIAYIYSTYNDVDSAGNTIGSGGSIYEQFEFTTMSDEGCELIFDLAFCDKVAYAVPNGNSSQENDVLKEMYDSNAKSIYQNFSKALQQVACNTTSDAIFSPLLTCDDCSESYKDWLCAVTIPRCSTRSIDGYKYREVNESRSDFINYAIQPMNPYYEILPCVNVCEAVVRTCPSVFGFACPTGNDTISLSYYWDTDDSEYPTCNYIGDTVISSFGSKLIMNWQVLVLAFSLYFM